MKGKSSRKIHYHIYHSVKKVIYLGPTTSTHLPPNLNSLLTGLHWVSEIISDFSGNSFRDSLRRTLKIIKNV